MYWLTVSIYAILLFLAGTIGGRLSEWLVVTHRRLQFMISFVAGLMLGIALLRLMPHAAILLPDVNHMALWMTAGLMIMFIFLRMFHFHQHSLAEEPLHTDAGNPEGSSHHHSHRQERAAKDPQSAESKESSKEASKANCPGEGDCGDETCLIKQHIKKEGECQAKEKGSQESGEFHPHYHHQGCDHDHESAQPVWSAVMLGLVLHATLDGLTLGASILAGANAQTGGNIGMGIVGLGAFLAILLHKPLDTMTLVALMSKDEDSKKIHQLVLISFSLVCPAAMVMAVSGLNQFGSAETYILGACLAMSAGLFLCISLSDLLPEIEFHSHDQVTLTMLILGGVMTAYLIGCLESGHLMCAQPMP